MRTALTPGGHVPGAWHHHERPPAQSSTSSDIGAAQNT